MGIKYFPMESSENNPQERFHRRSVRLRGYDYAGRGVYFTTICAHQNKTLFGTVLAGEIRLSRIGLIVEECLLALPSHFPGVLLDSYVVMPNHLHGLIVIGVGAQHAAPLRPQEGAARRAVRVRSLGAIVRSLKAAVTKRVNELYQSPGRVLWQRNYYEHIVRPGKEIDVLRSYILENPARWACDRHNPQRITTEEGTWRGLDWLI